MTNPEDNSLADWLQEKPFTLAFSAGLFGYYAHAGALQALVECELSPEAVCGASSGAIIAGLFASGISAVDIGEKISGINRSDFWDPAFGNGILRGDKLEDMLRAILTVDDFNKCKKPLKCSVYDIESRKTEVASSGSIARTIRASCAFPVLFQSVKIDGRPKRDGGIDDRLGLAGASTKTRVLLHCLNPNKNANRVHQAKQTRGDYLQVISPPDLPRINPFNLSQGLETIKKARESTLRALDRPIY